MTISLEVCGHVEIVPGTDACLMRCRMQHTPHPVRSPDGQALDLGKGYNPSDPGPQIAHEGTAVSLGGSYAPSREQQGLPGRDEVVVGGERLKLQAGYATRGNNPCACVLMPCYEQGLSCMAIPCMWLWCSIRHLTCCCKSCLSALCSALAVCDSWQALLSGRLQCCVLLLWLLTLVSKHLGPFILQLLCAQDDGGCSSSDTRHRLFA